jgi:hypothetical protein
MGHQISAALLKGLYEDQRARSFDLTAIQMSPEITMFPLCASFCDRWGDVLRIAGFRSHRPLLNCNVVHHMMNRIASAPLFAIIETDYFGGNGSQAAAVYQGHVEIMPAAVSPIGERTIGPINAALRLLGVVPSRGADEFDSLGLGAYRSFDDLFESD